MKNTKALSLLVSEDTIQDGVMVIDTVRGVLGHLRRIENTIQNGVIDTFGVDVDLNHLVENTIQNGVKHTEPGGYLGSIEMKGKIVHQLESPKQNEEVEDVIKNGIKETKSLEHDRTTYHGYFNQERGSHTPLDKVQDVLKNGIKETWGYEKQPQIRVNDVIQTGKKI